MKLKIIKKNENKLLSRIEIEAEVTFDVVTPSRMELREAIAKELKEKPERTVIFQIKTDFGNKRADIYAEIYNDENIMKDVVPKHIITRHKVEEPKEEKKEEVPAPAKPEEKPAETPAEEPKKEESAEKSEEEVAKPEEKNEEQKPEEKSEEKSE